MDPENPLAAPPLIAAQLVITMNVNGQVAVNGPVQDRILCLGMLELAKLAVLNYQPAPKIVPAGVH